ncbi:hypothetical protein DUI87_18581 [Hirundo rustica rustica]|uniref:Uncharacterized protein n=1 Tax=Hirundo rustica rustica TaxID=333673 RepID=A0A3M0JZ14_HIRRU|nr:hypothetical protein DUI87_18581 [Hirundo rustica rustica]
MAVRRPARVPNSRDSASPPGHNKQRASRNGPTAVCESFAAFVAAAFARHAADAQLFPDNENATICFARTEILPFQGQNAPSYTSLDTALQYTVCSPAFTFQINGTEGKWRIPEKGICEKQTSRNSVAPI